MASLNQCLASLARLSLTAPARPAVAPTIPKFLLPSAVPLVRHASGGGGMRKRPAKKKKVYKMLRCYDLTPMTQYSLCDAMRQVPH